MNINIVDSEFTKWFAQSLTLPGMRSVSMDTIGHDATQFALLISELFVNDKEHMKVFTERFKVCIESDMREEEALDRWRMLKIFVGITVNANFATPPWAVVEFAPCIKRGMKWLLADEREASPLIYHALTRSLVSRSAHIKGILTKLKSIEINGKAIEILGSRFGFESTTPEELGNSLARMTKEDFSDRLKVVKERAESIEMQRAMLLIECMAHEKLKGDR